MVNQVVGSGGGRAAILTFQNYQQSQGGKYECRVTVPGTTWRSCLFALVSAIPSNGCVLCRKKSRRVLSMQLWSLYSDKVCICTYGQVSKGSNNTSCISIRYL